MKNYKVLSMSIVFLYDNMHAQKALSKDIQDCIIPLIKDATELDPKLSTIDLNFYSGTQFHKTLRNYKGREAEYVNSIERLVEVHVIWHTISYVQLKRMEKCIIEVISFINSIFDNMDRSKLEHEKLNIQVLECKVL